MGYLDMLPAYMPSGLLFIVPEQRVETSKSRWRSGMMNERVSHYLRPPALSTDCKASASPL